MAEKRMLHKALSQSRKVNSLSLKAALLWTWSIPWFDAEGFIEAEPDFIKLNVVPRRNDILEKQIAELIKEITETGLWTLLKDQKTGKIIAKESNYEEYQKIRKDREGESKFTPGELLEQSGTTPTYIKDRIYLDKDRLREREEHACGEFLNIFLNEDEKKKLETKYGNKAVQNKIESFSNSLKSQPQKYSKYQNHYATLNNWLRKDGDQLPQPKTEIKKTFLPCPICKKETTQADIDRFNSCPTCFKPLPQDKIKELIQGIGKPIK